MPKLLNPALYNIIYRVSKQVFTTYPLAVKKNMTTYGVGTPLFRYVGYRDSKPQEDSNARTIWNPIENDENNRWTGIGAGGKGGTSGLYLSMEESMGNDTSFPELEHYQSPGESSQVLQYMEYKPGAAPQWKDVTGNALRSVFLFTLHSKIKGLNLMFPNALIDIIFKEAKKDILALLGPISVESLYFNLNDASFNRAIGNAAFDTVKKCDFLITTSVRDKKSINVVMKGDPHVAMDQLKAEGRITFLRDDELRAVYTKDDLLYNGKLEQEEEQARMGGLGGSTD